MDYEAILLVIGSMMWCWYLFHFGSGKQLFNLAWGTGEDFNSQIQAIPTISMSQEKCNSAGKGWSDGMKHGIMCMNIPSTGHCKGR